MPLARLQAAFSKCEAEGKTVFVGFVTAGFPNAADTVPILLALQAGGTDIIEIGMPFSDPMADGSTIEKANGKALSGDPPMSFDTLMKLIKEARSQGLTVPVIMMGYYNPLLAFGLEKAGATMNESGIDGMIVVDLPPEEAQSVLAICTQFDLSFVPLVAPTSTDERIEALCKVATSFIYCVSVAGVTGSRKELPADLPDFIARVKSKTELPLCVGFGVSTPEHVAQVKDHGATGAVVGSAIVKAIESAGDGASPEDRAAKVSELVSSLNAGKVVAQDAMGAAAEGVKVEPLPARTEYMFGDHGGQYIPETLMKAHNELATEYDKAMADPEFLKELDDYRKGYIGGPTPLYHAKNFTKAVAEQNGGSCAQIWLKREELAHTGAHKINNAIGQGLLARRLGKKRIIAETGAGQHGVGTATACALLGLECVVYMGAVDVVRQSLNVFRMKMLGATVVPVESGSKTLKDAINEAMRDWVTNPETTHYIIGSAVGPYPFPKIVRDFQAVIGKEARAQMLDSATGPGCLPDVAVAAVGGGSNAIGLFFPFIGDETVRLVGAEAGGVEGLAGKHSATLTGGTPGVLHGMRTYLLQNSDGQIEETHSISAGLDYPGVGPEHAWLKDTGRADYVVVTDGEALDALQMLSRCEGIIPALEPSHAIWAGIQEAKKLGPEKHVLINMCGRGDKDMLSVAKALGINLMENPDDQGRCM